MGRIYNATRSKTKYDTCMYFGSTSWNLSFDPFMCLQKKFHKTELSRKKVMKVKRLLFFFFGNVSD